MKSQTWLGLLLALSVTLGGRREVHRGGERSGQECWAIPKGPLSPI